MKKIISLYAPTLVKRTKPLNFKTQDNALFDQEWKRLVSGVNIYEASKITLSYRLRFYKNGWPHRTLNKLNPRYSSGFWILNFLRRIRELFLTTRISSKEITWVIDEWGTGYFHWMTESLPRLLAVKMSFPQKKLTVALTENYRQHSFIAETLNLFDTSALYFNITHCIIANRLIFPTPVVPGGNYQPELMQKLRLYLLSAMGINPEATPSKKKSYVSREKASRRKIVNEGDILPLLKDYGFETCFFEDLSFRDQVYLANDSKYMISIHGAGLTNMMFMKKDSIVLELRRKNDTQNNCYFALADALQINYVYLQCEPDKGMEHNANLLVDVMEFKRVLENYFR